MKAGAATVSAAGAVKRRPTLPAMLRAMLGLMGRGAVGQLQIDGRSEPGGAKTRFRVPSEIAHEFIPGALLGHLQDRCWALQASLPVHVGGQPSTIGVLVATFRFERVFRNDAGEEYGHGFRPVLPSEQLRAAHAKAAAFLEPTMTIDAGSVQAAVWALETPLDLTTPQAQAAALGLHREIALHLEADPIGADAGILDLRVPVPGSVIREPPYNELVAVPHFNPELTYSAAAIEAALQQQRKAAR